MENVSFQHKILEKEFMEDYEKCKQIVDSGIKDYFILLNNKSFTGVSEIGNTTLKDIECVFGSQFIPMFRFADLFNCNGTKNENAQSIRIRRVNSGDKRKLRADYRFIPNECFVCEWRDGTGFGLLLPFVQSANGKIDFLIDNPTFSQNRQNRQKKHLSEWTLPKMATKRIVEILPDYSSSLLAIVRYKDVDMIIPVEKKTAKNTFKNRDKTDGVKRHLIHDVKEYGRKNLKTVDSVQYHLRGTSEFRINGIDITLCGSVELSAAVMKKGRSNGKK